MKTYSFLVFHHLPQGSDHVSFFSVSYFTFFECSFSNFGFHRTNFDVGAMNFGASNGKVSSYFNRKLQLPFIKVDLSNFNFLIVEWILELQFEEMEKEQEMRSEPWSNRFLYGTCSFIYFHQFYYYRYILLFQLFFHLHKMRSLLVLKEIPKF